MIRSPILGGLLARDRGPTPVVTGSLNFHIAQSLVSEVHSHGTIEFVVRADCEFGNVEIFPIFALFATECSDSGCSKILVRGLYRQCVVVTTFVSGAIAPVQASLAPFIELANRRPRVFVYVRWQEYVTFRPAGEGRQNCSDRIL
jgi:hypothetical protein